MIMYGAFQAKECEKTPVIDFIEFEFPKISEDFLPEDLENNDVVLSCDWDESCWEFDPDSGEGSFRVKGIYLNQVYANGHIEDFKSSVLREMQVYTDADSGFELTGLLVEDGEKSFEFSKEQMKDVIVTYTRD